MSKRKVSDDSSDEEYSSDEETSWIYWFCGLRGNDYYTEVDEDYAIDDFNLTGLRSMVPNYDYALDLILDRERDELLTEEQQEIIQSSAEMLYGLIHARYILTNRGLNKMKEKFESNKFGRCPRVFCQRQPVLPVGQSDIPRMNNVKLFCPRCQDIYYPKLSRHAVIDGAYFGTTFPHLLLQMYPDLQPPRNRLQYVPRIYGFKIYEGKRPTHQSTNNKNSSNNKKENSKSNEARVVEVNGDGGNGENKTTPMEM